MQPPLKEKLNWQDKNVRNKAFHILSNLAHMSHWRKECFGCGVEFPPNATDEECETAVQHGKGCVWAHTRELFGREVNQK